MSKLVKDNNSALFCDIKLIIEQAKANLALSVNAEITRVYWKVGHRIRVELLNNQRAEYGKKIIKLLADNLTQQFGPGWSEKQLRHCLRIVETFPELLLEKLHKAIAIARQRLERSDDHFKGLAI